MPNMSIKQHFKHTLNTIGIWYPLNLIRSTPLLVCWLKNGCRTMAPHPIKLLIIKSYLKWSGINHFLETGTYLGDTLDYFSRTGIQCTSIELSHELYEAACKRFIKRSNVKLLQGDSGERLPFILQNINEPTLFWLDGHYSAGITAKAKTHTPIVDEINAILAHPIKGHIILIDDARCFNGTNDYPHLDELLKIIRDSGYYRVEISADIIRLLPSSIH